MRANRGMTPADDADYAAGVTSWMEQGSLSASHRTALRQLITSLLKTGKDVAFYPANSPVIRESVARVVSALREVSEVADPVLFEVQRDQFLVGGTRLIDEIGPEQQFAEQLFALGVRALEIRSSSSPQEIFSFLTVFGKAHRDHVGFQALAEQLEQAGVSGITVYPAARLDTSRLVDGQIADTHEMAVGAAIEEDEGQVARLLGEFTKRLGASEQDSRRLLDYLRESDCLVSAVHELDMLPGDETTRPLFGRLLDSIVEAAHQAQRSPPSLRMQLLHELARAVETMGTELRKTFVREQLIAQAGPDSGAAALLSRLSDDTLAEELADKIVLHGGTDAAVQTYFHNMPVSAERRNTIIELACKRVAERSDDRELAEKVLSSIRSPGEHVDDGIGGEPVDSRAGPELPDLGVLALRDEERAEIERMARSALDNVEQNNARTLIALLNGEHEPDAIETIVAGLEALRMKLLRMPDGLCVAIEIVNAYVQKRHVYAGRGEPDQADPVGAMLAKTIEAACSGESLALLLDRAVRCDKSSREYRDIVGYFDLIGDPAYRVLVDELRNQSVRSRRMAARALVVSIGDPCVELLTRNIANEQWFVVRNAALILGDMRSNAGIFYLSQTLKHADRRVRREAVNSLGKIGTPQAARALTTVLSSDDLETVHAAVRWLGLLRTTEAVTDLVRLMDSLGNSATERQVKLSIIDALMQIGSPLALVGLERVQRRCRWLFFRRDAAVAQAAARAAEAIRERIDKEMQ